MVRTLVYGIAVLLLIVGITAEARVPSPETAEAIPFASILDDEDPEPSLSVDLPAVGEGFTLDIAEMLPALARIPDDDRADQIADWAVYGSLLQLIESEDAFREATFELTPVRLPELSELYDFNYGPGRRVVRGDGTAWLFHDAGDTNAPVTLARMADTVLMETGEVPRTFVVFSYRLDGPRGELSLNREPDVTSEQMYSAEYGWVEETYAGLDQLESLLGRIDDLVHVRAVDHELRIGGRRFDRDCAPGQTRGSGLCHITAGVTLDDVAALYQAHAELEDRQDTVESGLAFASPVQTAFNGLIGQLNDAIRDANIGLNPSGDGSWAVEEAMGRLEFEIDRASDPDLELGDKEYSDWLPRRARNLDLDEQMAAVDRYRDRVEPVIERQFANAAASVDIPPADPGFSLDPRSDRGPLARDLRRLARNPVDVFREAVGRARRAPDGYREDSNVRWLKLGQDMLELQRELGFVPHVSTPRPVRSALIEAAKVLDAAQNDHAAGPAYLTIAQLESELAADEEFVEAGLLAALLKYVDAKHKLQCARYDGPLDGTRVGMTLFYTDALAKIWESVDYHRSAPVAKVDGFLSAPRVTPQIEPTYWPEMEAKPATRLWFGPREDRFRGTDNWIGFAPIATRVYAAGSNDLAPGEESSPAEDSRRTLGWWDRHFARIADHEGEYYRQNEIMKWSVVTGWMQENGHGRSLATVEVDHSNKFDTWYEDSKERLRYSLGMRMLPRDRWTGGTECMEILASYTFGMRGGTGYIAGGVSLGSARTLTKARLDRAVPKSRLRAGLTRLDDGIDGLLSAKGTSFNLPSRSAPTGGLRVRAGVADAAKEVQFRAAGARMPGVRGVDTTIELGAGGGRVAMRTPSGADFGSVTFDRLGAKAKMAWQPGSVAADAGLQRRLLDATSDGSVDATRAARLDGASPTDGVYVVDLDGGVAVVRPHGSKPGARVTSLTRDADQLGDAELVTSRSLDADGKSFVHARTLANEDARALVRDQPWQRLRGNDTKVERVFTRTGPGEGAKRVELKTGDPELPSVEAYVDGDAIFLKRPGRVDASQPFEDLVVRRGVDGDGIRGVVDGATELRGNVATETISRRGIVDDGDASSVLDALAGGSRPGETLRAARRDVASALPSAAQGRRSALGRAFARGDDAGGALTDVLDQVRRGKVDGVAGKGRLGGTSNDDELARFAQRGGKTPDGALTLRTNGNRVETSVELGPSVRRETLAATTRRDAAARVHDGEAVAYFEDGSTVGELDWFARPGKSVSQAADAKGYKWERLRVDDPALTPSEYVHGGTRFRRADNAANPGSPLGGSLVPPVIYLIAACTDEDDPSVCDAA